MISNDETEHQLSSDTGARLGGILSAPRNRGEFLGELGETFLFTPPSGAIPAKRLMVIELGEENSSAFGRARIGPRWSSRANGGVSLFGQWARLARAAEHQTDDDGE
jgi:hypothetical protein